MSISTLNITNSAKGFRDTGKEKRIFEHLTNQHDIITEEDIRNVRTDVEITYSQTVVEVRQKLSVVEK